MIILVVNAGSSSLKYQLIDMKDESVLAKGNCDRIGIDGHISHKTSDGRKFEADINFPTHTEAFMELVKALTTGDAKVIDSMDEISAVGHRIVQGADVFDKSVLVTDEVIDQIDDLRELAPVHNHAHALALRACKSVIPANVPQVVVFDTAFHQTMPPKAFMFGLPYEDYEKYHVRKYGFHGTSHRFVSKALAKAMGKDVKDLKIVSCHLGNGSSITAVRDGKCYDTSMGLTPLEGLVMGTRSGDIDPALVTYIRQKENLPSGKANEILNKKSGVLGISGVSSDFRDIEAAVAEGNERAALALKVFAHKVRFYIGAYIAEMNGCDAIVFTAGVGENDITMRELICHDLGNLGIKIDPLKNKIRGKETIISADDARVKCLLIPTNEELMIAKDTYDIVKGLK